MLVFSSKTQIETSFFHKFKTLWNIKLFLNLQLNKLFIANGIYVSCDADDNPKLFIPIFLFDSSLTGLLRGR